MLKTSYQAVKGMVMGLTGGKPDETIENIVDSVTMFMESFDKFIGVFDDDYTGGDFCAGLTFGMQGT